VTLPTENSSWGNSVLFNRNPKIVNELPTREALAFAADEYLRAQDLRFQRMSQEEFSRAVMTTYDSHFGKEQCPNCPSKKQYVRVLNYTMNKILAEAPQRPEDRLSLAYRIALRNYLSDPQKRRELRNKTRLNFQRDMFFKLSDPSDPSNLQSRFKEAASLAVQNFIERNQLDSNFPIEKLLEKTRILNNRIQQPANNLCLALKIVFHEQNNDSNSWRSFRNQIDEKYVEILTENPDANPQDAFWSTLKNELFKSNEPGLTTIDGDEFFRRVSHTTQLLAEFSKEGEDKNIFETALKITHELSFGDFSNSDQNGALATNEWQSFYADVSNQFGKLAERASKNFLEDAHSSRLRALIGGELPIRFAVIHEKGQYHLITKVKLPKTNEANNWLRSLKNVVTTGSVKGNSTTLFIINPDHALSSNSLPPNSKVLLKYARAQSGHVVIFDSRNNSFEPTKLIKKPALLNPLSLWWFFRSRYENPTMGTAKAAVLSVAINGGSQALLLMEEAQRHPDTTHFSPVALGFYCSYMIFCAAWNQFYDNLSSVEGDSQWKVPLETAKKIAFAAPVTIAFLALTQPHASILYVFLATLPIVFTEKNNSTMIRSLIRVLAREKVLGVKNDSEDGRLETGDFDIRVGHLNPIRWLQLSYYMAKNIQIPLKSIGVNLIKPGSWLPLARNSIQAFNPLLWVGVSRQISNTFNEHIQLIGPEKIRIVKIDRGSGLREIEGYGRNYISSIARTGGLGLGIALQVSVAEIANLAKILFYTTRINQFKGNPAMVADYRQRRAEAIQDIGYLPGLGRLIRRGVTKLREISTRKSCSTELSAIAQGIPPEGSL